MLSAGFFQEDDKQKHMAISVPFGAMGGLICSEKKSWELTRWQVIACGTFLGMIPGLIKEAKDEANYGGWSNKDLAADAIGSFIGAFGTVTILEFSSGDW